MAVQRQLRSPLGIGAREAIFPKTGRDAEFRLQGFCGRSRLAVVARLSAWALLVSAFFPRVPSTTQSSLNR